MFIHLPLLPSFLHSKSVILAWALIIHVDERIQVNVKEVEHLITYQKVLHSKRKSSMGSSMLHAMKASLRHPQNAKRTLSFLSILANQRNQFANSSRTHVEHPHTQSLFQYTCLCPLLYFPTSSHHALTLLSSSCSAFPLPLWIVIIERYFKVFGKVFLYQKEEKNTSLFLHFVSCSI